MEGEIVNRVAKSGLITINLEEWYPQGKRIAFDLKDNLWQGLALKEKDFRAFLKEQDWSAYQDAHVAIFCSADAIIPTWAYMLVATYLEPYAATIVFGDLDALEIQLFENMLANRDFSEYKDARIVVKGCSDKAVPPAAYVTLTRKLRPLARTIMYGEPCSTVPVYKQPRPSK